MKRRGATLIELVVVSAVVGVLISLLIAAVQKVRATAARMKCTNNLRQIALASHEFHDVQGQLPPAIRKPTLGDQYYHLSWLGRLLPYIDLQPLWNRVEQDYSANLRPFARPRHSAVDWVVRGYTCPADVQAQSAAPLPGTSGERYQVAFTSYLGNLGVDYRRRDGVIVPNGGINLLGVTDGTSSTLLVGERPPSLDSLFGWWYSGRGQGNTGSLDYVLGSRELNSVDPLYHQYAQCGSGPFWFSNGRLADYCSVFHFWSLHSGGANFAFCDGSVHFLPYSARDVMVALATRAGGEIVAIPD